MNDGQNILSGLRVIDCGTYIAGPAAATIMSDFGAEVIKIERRHVGRAIIRSRSRCSAQSCWRSTSDC